jgi:hypothetical protein
VHVTKGTSHRMVSGVQALREFARTCPEASNQGVSRAHDVTAAARLEAAVLKAAVARLAGAYTRSLFSSIWAVSDTQEGPTHPKLSLTPP